MVCIARGQYSPWPKDYRLLVTDNYFVEVTEPNLEPGRTVRGLVKMASITKYMVVAAKAPGTDEMALYVTDDARIWHRAVFQGDHKIEEDAYTLLESTNHSIQLDVMNTRPSNPMGVLFTSNSNGTYFTPNAEHTNRNRVGVVDFEKVQGIQGIVIVNVVDNWAEVEKSPSAKKKIRSQISFDDGRHFRPLRVGSEDLHLHSVSDLADAGRVFSSPAPGIVMAVGNTGSRLEPYEHGHLYVSDDAGLTWKKAREGPHRYEFGDQGAVLVAVADQNFTTEFVYSIDHAKSWKSVDLGAKVKVDTLTTTPDSTSLKFVLLAKKADDADEPYLAVAIDFDGMHERKCGPDDFERWCARVDDQGQPSCLMGHKQFFRRRKAETDCFVDEEFKDVRPEFEPCDCTDEDFECDYNFVRADGECVAAGPVIVPDGACPDSKGTFMGSSGYRLIPGNECRRRKGSAQKDQAVERKCGDSVKPPANGKIGHEITHFDAMLYSEYHYLERTETSTGDDETVIMRTGKEEIYISHDHGKTWDHVLEGKKIEAIYPHKHFKDVVFFVTEGRTVYYSTDRGRRIRKFEAPLKPTVDLLAVISFHPNKKDWLIWTGAKDCGGSWTKEDCHSESHVTTDRGDTWKLLLRYVGKCRFISEEGRAKLEEKLTYCVQHEGENSKHELQLVSSEDFFDEQTVHFDQVIGFTTVSEFIVAAVKDPDQQSLKAEASVDGETFADALFPPNFKVPHQEMYTVLDGSTHSVFLHVTVDGRSGHEYGSILKSNSNGTSYVVSINGVHRDPEGYVDFERVEGIEGVAIVNVVDNVDELTKEGSDATKKLKTMITHNDGAEWSLLAPPKIDAEGKAIECVGGALERCSLHLHGYTERSNPANTYSSPSAVGLLMGAGNVGERLEPTGDADTFMSRDGGISWSAVKKGRYLWEYGDQGSIIVIVPHSTPTTQISYSLDEGRTWQDYRFIDDAGKKMRVSDISTVPTDNSRNMLLWGQFEGEERRLSTVNLDFTGLHDRMCVLDKSEPEQDDYYLWKPKHPAQADDCLFGHVTQYHRKRPEANCYNGREVQRLFSVSQNCSCTRQDFECDYNYERQRDNSCALVPGLSPSDHSKVCREDEQRTEYYEPTGYRRIPLTQCVGGRELEFLESKARPCPRHEEEFKKIHRQRVSGFVLFLAVVVPIGLAMAAGYWVWRHWDGKFGRIQLGQPGGLGGNGTNAGGHGGTMVWDAERVWIKYPVMVVAVSVALVIALPDTLSRLWRSARARFGGYRTRDRLGLGTNGTSRGGGRRGTTRDSLTRGGRRGDYDAVVVHDGDDDDDVDEGILLGEDSDDDDDDHRHRHI